MFIDWLANKDFGDSESVIISVAGVVIFAVAVFILDAFFLWNLNLLMLTGIAVVAGGIGFFVAKTSPVVIKVIPPAVVICVTALLAKEIYQSYTFQKERTEFLAKTDSCNALGLQIVNKTSWTPVCMHSDTLANNQYCSYYRDNEWFCHSYKHSDVIAKPEGHKLLQVVIVE